MVKLNISQTTVEEAAKTLGVTPRSVINYIRAKEIEAVKIGKTWYISKSSLDAFKQRYGFSEKLPSEEKLDTEFQKISEKTNSKRKKEIYPVYNLKLFQLAKELLSNINAHTLLPDNRPDLVKKVFNLKSEALENIGAGFYAFGSKNKATLYNRSREKVGGILSIIYFYQNKNTDIPNEILKIEEELMPAFSSLIRRIEKKNERT